jgi:hypothetical protein
MIKKILLWFLYLIIAVIVVLFCWQLQPFSNIIKVSDVDKMIIGNFVGDRLFTTTDKRII